MRYRSLGAIVAVALVLGCDDSSRPMSPAGAERPQASISDGSTGGNPDFFFLPPVLGNPSGKPGYTAGAFNGGWRPVIEICQLQARDSNVCVSTFKTFSGKEITINAGGEYYSVNWDTRSPSLDLSKFYRVSVKVAGQVLGYFDVDPVSTARLKNEETGDYIALVDGRTLPIKFRIEQGALENTAVEGDFVEMVVTNAGGNVVTNTGYAAAHFPQGWLPAGVSSVIVTIARNPTGPTNDCHQTTALMQFEGCYQFETYPEIGNFALPVRVEVCTELDEEDSRYEDQILFSSDVDEPLTELDDAAESLITCDDFPDSTPPILSGNVLDRVGDGLWRFAGRIGHALSPKSAYAIDAGRGGTTIKFSRVGWGIPLEIDPIGSTTLTSGAGLVLPLGVTVSGAHEGALLSDIPVTFAVTSGGGSVNVPSAVTDDGEASVQWTLGSTPGTQTLTASITTVDHAPGATSVPRVYTPVTKSVTFTVNALAVATTTISGVVLDSDSDPISGAQVSTSGCTITCGAAAAITDVNGAYTLPALNPAQFGAQVPVTASAPGFVTSAPATVTLSGGTVTQNFTLTPIIIP